MIDEAVRWDAKNTIRIYQDNGVLREYLDGRKKEVVDIMVMLFDQNYAMEVYDRERERRGEKKGEKRGKMEGIVGTCRRLGTTIDEAVSMLMESFGLSEEAASKHVMEFWGS